MIVLLFVTTSCSQYYNVDRSLARSPDTLLDFYKDCILSGEYDFTYFIFNTDFQDIAPRSVYIMALSNFSLLREFILSLQTKYITAGANKATAILYSKRFGLSISIDMFKPEASRTWRFKVDKEKLEMLINKFWKWYDLQLQSADYQRYTYPKTWHYEGLE